MARASTVFSRGRGREEDTQPNPEDSGATTAAQQSPEDGADNGADSGEGGEFAGADSASSTSTNGDGSASTESGEKSKKKSDEQKAADFRRLANSRGSDALKAMIGLGHLANPSQYLWTEDQENALFGPLEEKIRELRKTFVVARTPPEDGKKRKGTKQLLLNVG